PAFWDNPKFNQANQPVVGVSWFDAAAYAKWANKRLPTEEEWEKAARGTDGNLYPWGKNLPDAENCNYGESIGRTSDVNRYKTNKSVYGCCDLIGNVWEWTRDEKTDDASCKIIKGGSWLSFPLQLKCHNKDYLRTDEMKDYVGFRCVAND
ncbi:MAG: formylglycine-generating enzyme family protein, partial [bacterium]